MGNPFSFRYTLIRKVNGDEVGRETALRNDQIVAVVPGHIVVETRKALKLLAANASVPRVVVADKDMGESRYCWILEREKDAEGNHEPSSKN